VSVNAAGLISLMLRRACRFRSAGAVAGSSSSPPDGTNVTATPVSRHIDSAMAKAIARAFRWRHMLENGRHATIAEIAAAERIESCLRRESGPSHHPW
jgi:hypothetical protein